MTTKLSMAGAGTNIWTDILHPGDDPIVDFYKSLPRDVKLILRKPNPSDPVAIRAAFSRAQVSQFAMCETLDFKRIRFIPPEIKKLKAVKSLTNCTELRSLKNFPLKCSEDNLMVHFKQITAQFNKRYGVDCSKFVAIDGRATETTMELALNKLAKLETYMALNIPLTDEIRRDAATLEDQISLKLLKQQVQTLSPFAFSILFPSETKHTVDALILADPKKVSEKLETLNDKSVRELVQAQITIATAVLDVERLNGLGVFYHFTPDRIKNCLAKPVQNLNKEDLELLSKFRKFCLSHPDLALDNPKLLREQLDDIAKTIIQNYKNLFLPAFGVCNPSKVPEEVKALGQKLCPKIYGLEDLITAEMRDEIEAAIQKQLPVFETLDYLEFDETDILSGRLSLFPNVTSVKITACKLDDLVGLEDLPKLQKLTISYLKGIKSWEGLPLRFLIDEAYELQLHSEKTVEHIRWEFLKAKISRYTETHGVDPRVELPESKTLSKEELITALERLTPPKESEGLSKPAQAGAGLSS